MNDLLVHVSRRAMACEFEVIFPAALYPEGAAEALKALDLVEELESRFSYFRPDGELGHVNQLAGCEPVIVSAELFGLLQFARRLHDETGGAYDITSAPLWELWGFARRSGEIPAEADLAEARALVGGQLVELDPAERTVRFLRPGMKINLASLGKGYALDACAVRLHAAGMSNFLLQAGQSSVLARGGQPGDYWEIGLKNPLQPNRRLGAVRLRDKALGTSGIQFQSFRHAGRRYGHILDPRSGQPSDGVLSATVVASDAVTADALSTAFHVLGAAGAIEYCRRRPEIGVVMVSAGENSGQIRVDTANLGDDLLPGWLD